MENYGILLMWAFAAIGFAFLNLGDQDKESRRREAYFARFEEETPSVSPAATLSDRGLAGKGMPIALSADPLKK
jgi:hypothetical protein